MVICPSLGCRSWCRCIEGGRVDRVNPLPTCCRRPLTVALPPAVAAGYRRGDDGQQENPDADDNLPIARRVKPLVPRSAVLGARRRHTVGSRHSLPSFCKNASTVSLDARIVE